MPNTSRSHRNYRQAHHVGISRIAQCNHTHIARQIMGIHVSARCLQHGHVSHRNRQDVVGRRSGGSIQFHRSHSLETRTKTHGYADVVSRANCTVGYLVGNESQFPVRVSTETRRTRAQNSAATTRHLDASIARRRTPGGSAKL